MARKKLYNKDGIVYSTSPDFQNFEEETNDNYPPPAEQPLRVILDKKHRAGKLVTIVSGFSMKPAEIEETGRKLKAFCGSGGSVKDGEILVQGDHRDKILQWLLKNGFKKTKKI